MKIIIVWDVKASGEAERYQRLRKTCYIISRAAEATGFCQNAWHHIPNDCNMLDLRGQVNKSTTSEMTLDTVIWF